MSKDTAGCQVASSVKQDTATGGRPSGVTAGAMRSTEEDFGDLKDLTGRVIAERYKLTRFISAGGFGAVYEATDEKFVGKKVAIKLCIQISSENAFLREAQLLGQLNHDNIVRVFDQGVHKGIPYIVMELLSGESVGHLLSRYDGRMPKKLLVRFVRDIGRALANAHKHHLVHRDLKPNNVLLVDTGDGEDVSRGVWKFVLLDFGIAAKTNANNSLANKTFAGAGTPEYMAPEQVKSLEPSEQTDIYTFGVLLFQMLTGKLPFPLNGDSYADIARVMTAIVDTLPVKPSAIAPDAGIPPQIDDLILECMRKEPAERPKSINEVRRRFLAVYEPDKDTTNVGMTLMPGFHAGRDTAAGGSTGRQGNTTIPGTFVLPMAMLLSIIFTVVGGAAAVMFLPSIFAPKKLEALAMVPSKDRVQAVAGGDPAGFFLKLTRPEGAPPVALALVGTLPEGIEVTLPETSSEGQVDVGFTVPLNTPPGEIPLQFTATIEGGKAPPAEAKVVLEVALPQVWMPTGGAGKFTGFGKLVRLSTGQTVYEQLACDIDPGVDPIRFLLIQTQSENPVASKPFYIQESKISRAVFTQFMATYAENKGWNDWLAENAGTPLVGSDDRLPAFGITANEAHACCKWLAGEKGNLPTRAQWWTAFGFFDRGSAEEKSPFASADAGGFFPLEPGPVGTAPQDITQVFKCRDMGANGQEFTRDTAQNQPGVFPLTPSTYMEMVGAETGIGLLVNFDDGEASLRTGNGLVGFGPQQKSSERAGSSFRAVIDID